MLLRQLKYFISIVKNNSFTEAAEECYISQSAISQQIQALENELDVQLIVRANRSFTLTNAGEYLYRQSLLLLDEVERVKKETIRLGGKEHREIRIGYLTGYMGSELSDAIADFSSEHPDVDIRVTSGNHEELRTLVLTKNADLLMSDQRRAFSDTFFNDPLYSCLCYVEVSTRSHLAALDQVSVDELRRIPCILISTKEQRNNEEDFYQSYLGFAGNFLFAENLEEARLMVSANKGFLPVQITRSSALPAGSTLSRIPLHMNGQQVERFYYAFWEKTSSTPEIERFVEILHKKFA